MLSQYIAKVHKHKQEKCQHKKVHYHEKQKTNKQLCRTRYIFSIVALLSVLMLISTGCSKLNGTDTTSSTETTVVPVTNETTSAPADDTTEPSPDTTVSESASETTVGNVTPETSAAVSETDAETVHVHELVLIESKSATCTELGEDIFICACGEKYFIKTTADALGRDTEPSTCTAGAFCRRCGAALGSPLGHIYGDWQTYISAGCEAKGEERTVCSRCGETVTRETAPLGHTFEGGSCQKCGVVDPAFGTLDFQLNDDNAGYTVIGIGSVAGVDINIPESHNGLPVVAIGDTAFKNIQSIRNVTLPASIVRIGHHAFFGCTALESIIFSSGLKSIGIGAFVNCSSLESIALPDTLADVGSDLFTGCASLAAVEIGGGLTYISEAMFVDCAALRSIELPMQTVSVGTDAFAGCLSLSTVSLPENLTRIGSGAFASCRALTTVNFGGTVAEWTALTAGEIFRFDNGANIPVYCKDGQTVTPTIELS